MSIPRPTSRPILILAALLALLAFAMPERAWATGPTDDCGPGGALATANQGIASTFAQVGQAKIVGQNAVADLYGRINIAANKCLQNLQTLLQTIGAKSDPFNLLWSALSKQILAIVNQACTVAMTDVSQLKQYLLSQLNQFCIPMPNLGLGLNAFHLTASKPCTGIPLLQGISVPPGGALPTFAWPGFFPAASFTPARGLVLYPGR